MKSIQLIALAFGIAFAFTTTAGTNTYSGLVTDAEGHPIAGVTVDFWPYTGWASMPSETKAKQSIITGTNGGFEFTVEKGYGYIVAQKPGLASAWTTWYPERSDGEKIFLTSPKTVAGVVVDEAGKPVSDADVFVSGAYLCLPFGEDGQQHNYLSREVARTYFSTRSGTDGRFCINGFPTNATLDLGVGKSGKVLREKQREYASPDNMMCSAGQQDLKLMIEIAGTIEGKVAAVDGSASFTNAQLWLRADGRAHQHQRSPVQSVTNGVFRFPDLASGLYYVCSTFGTNALTDWVAESVPVTVIAGQTTRDVRVTPTKGGLLEVIVVSSVDQKPIANVEVSAFVQNYQARNTTGTNGIALLRLPPGDYQVSAYQENSRAINTVNEKIEAGQTTRVHFELAPLPTITGRIVNSDGTPVVGMDVFVMPNNGGGASATTDTNGNYKLTWNPQNGGGSPSTSCLFVRDLKRNLAAARDLQESTTVVDLRLESGQVLAGSVEDINGKPLTNAVVQVVFWTGYSGEFMDRGKIKIDAQGRFEATGLPRNRRYGVTATAKGYGTANSNSLQDAGERIEIPPFALKLADRKISGSVIDVDEKPVAKASIYTQGEGQPSQINVKSDEKGNSPSLFVKDRWKFRPAPGVTGVA